MLLGYSYTGDLSAARESSGGDTRVKAGSTSSSTGTDHPGFFYYFTWFLLFSHIFDYFQKNCL